MTRRSCWLPALQRSSRKSRSITCWRYLYVGRVVRGFWVTSSTPQEDSNASWGQPTGCRVSLKLSEESFRMNDTPGQLYWFTICSQRDRMWRRSRSRRRQSVREARLPHLEQNKTTRPSSCVRYDATKTKPKMTLDLGSSVCRCWGVLPRFLLGVLYSCRRRQCGAGGRPRRVLSCVVVVWSTAVHTEVGRYLGSTRNKDRQTLGVTLNLRVMRRYYLGNATGCIFYSIYTKTLLTFPGGGA